MKRGFVPVGVTVVAIGLAAAGCHGSNSPDDGQPVVVRVEYPPHTQPVFIEGAVTKLRLNDAKGALVADKDARTVVPVLLGTVSPGRYSLRAAVRPCDANCDRLDPVAFRCSGVVVVPEAGDARVIVTINPQSCVVTQQPDV